MLAECPEGSGSKDFFDWIKPFSKGCLDEALRASFTIGGYIFYVACESIRRSRHRCFHGAGAGSGYGRKIV